MLWRRIGSYYQTRGGITLHFPSQRRRRSYLLFSVCLLLTLWLLFPKSKEVRAAPKIYRAQQKRHNSIPVIQGSDLETAIRKAQDQLVQCPLDNVFARTTIRPQKTNNLDDVREGEWLSRPKDNLYILSATLDTRLKYGSQVAQFVRIPGMTKGPLGNPPGAENTSSIPTEQIFCYFWTASFNSELPDFVTSIPGTWDYLFLPDWDPAGYRSGEQYEPYLFSCPIPGPLTSYDHVALSKSQCPPHRTRKIQGLPIRQPQYTDTAVPNSPRFTVCLKGLLYPDSDKSAWLIEWIEFLRLLGVSSIQAYVFKVHPQMTKVLSHYEKLGTVHLTTITLPGNQPRVPDHRSQVLIHSLWQKRRNEIVIYNDCFYKHLGPNRHIVPLDLDEIIVPANGGTWQSLLEELLDSFFRSHPQSHRPPVGFSFRGSYFDPRYPRDESQPAKLLQANTRSVEITPAFHWVKSFISSEGAKSLFHHYPLSPLKGGISDNFKVSVDPDMALLHHYKICPKVICKNTQDITIQKTVVTNVVLNKYGPLLLEGIEKANKTIFS